MAVLALVFSDEKWTVRRQSPSPTSHDSGKHADPPQLLGLEREEKQDSAHWIYPRDASAQQSCVLVRREWGQCKEADTKPYVQSANAGPLKSEAYACSGWHWAG